MRPLLSRHYFMGCNISRRLENLFGGLSPACDFADLVQNGFYTRPVAHQRHDLAGLGPRYRTRLGAVRARRPLCLDIGSIHQTGSEGCHPEILVFGSARSRYGRPQTPTMISRPFPNVWPVQLRSSDILTIDYTEVTWTNVRLATFS
jgi:hypothetical protein